MNCLLTRDLRQLGLSHVDKLLIRHGLTHTLIDHNLLELGTLHYAGVAKLLHQSRNYLLLVLRFECWYVCHYLISSPDFLA